MKTAEVIAKAKEVESILWHKANRTIQRNEMSIECAREILAIVDEASGRYETTIIDSRADEVQPSAAVNAEKLLEEARAIVLGNIAATKLEGRAGVPTFCVELMNRYGFNTAINTADPEVRSIGRRYLGSWNQLVSTIKDLIDCDIVIEIHCDKQGHKSFAFPLDL